MSIVQLLMRICLFILLLFFLNFLRKKIQLRRFMIIVLFSQMLSFLMLFTNTFASFGVSEIFFDVLWWTLAVTGIYSCLSLSTITSKLLSIAILSMTAITVFFTLLVMMMSGCASS